MKILFRIYLVVFFLISAFFWGEYTDKTNIVAYDEKKIYEIAAKNEEIKAVHYNAERQLIYQFKFGDKIQAINQSAFTNLSYNVSYILNLPAKLIHNVIFDVRFVYFKDGSLSNQQQADYVMKETSNGERAILAGTLILLDIFQSIVGLFCASIMAVVGTVSGFIFNPIDTFLNIPSVLTNFLKAALSAVTNIFFW